MRQFARYLVVTAFVFVAMLGIPVIPPGASKPDNQRDPGQSAQELE